MALNEYNNNKKYFDPEVNTRFVFSNPNSELDPTRLNISYWAGSCKINICPKKGERADGTPEWDWKNGITAFLTSNKAELFKRKLIAFLKNPDEFINQGVNTKSGIIVISNGKDYGIDCPVIAIKKISARGEIESEFAYQINKNYHFSIQNFQKDGSYDKTYYNNLEVEQLITILDQFVKASSYAMAYTVIDANRFNNSIHNTKLELVGEKVGVQFKKNGNNKSSESYFYNDKNANSTSSDTETFETASADEIDSLING